MKNFIQKLIDRAVLYWKYEMTEQDLKDLEYKMSHLDEKIVDISTVPNWTEQRGVYRLRVSPATEGLVFSLIRPVMTDAHVQMVQEYDLLKWIYIHVYEDGYNHKVVVANQPNTDTFNEIPNYLCESLNFSEFAEVMYTSDCQNLMGC